MSAPHPWEKWFSKNQFVLVKGRQFKCQIHGMIGQIRNYASAQGITVNIVTKGDKITVTKE